MFSRLSATTTGVRAAARTLTTSAAALWVHLALPCTFFFGSNIRLHSLSAWNPHYTFLKNNETRLGWVLFWTQNACWNKMIVVSLLSPSPPPSPRLSLEKVFCSLHAAVFCTVFWILTLLALHLYTLFTSSLHLIFDYERKPSQVESDIMAMEDKHGAHK